MRVNGLADVVRCVNLAVSVDPDPEMWVTRGTGISELVGATDPDFARFGTRFDDLKRRIPVQGASLDAIIGAEAIRPEDVALVWSDTQGTETQVIETGASLWRAHVPLFAEIDPVLLDHHDGVDQFVALASEHFTHFLPRDHLIGRRKPTSNASLKSFVASIGTYTDVLLTNQGAAG